LATATTHAPCLAYKSRPLLAPLLTLLLLSLRRPLLKSTEPRPWLQLAGAEHTDARGRREDGGPVELASAPLFPSLSFPFFARCILPFRTRPSASSRSAGAATVAHCPGAAASIKPSGGAAAIAEGAAGRAPGRASTRHHQPVPRRRAPSPPGELRPPLPFFSSARSRRTTTSGRPNSWMCGCMSVATLAHAAWPAMGPPSLFLFLIFYFPLLENTSGPA
jgi:hypothetical protein